MKTCVKTAMAAVAVLCAVQILVGCGDKSSGSNNNVIYCESEVDCPPGWTCSGNVCIPPDGGPPDDTGSQVPDIQLDPETLDFGNPLLGVPVTEIVTITNVGSGALDIFSLEVQENDPVVEFESNPSGTVSITLMPNESTTVEVTLTNVDGMADTGRLVINSNDPDEAAAAVQLVSELKGGPLLDTCVVEQPPSLQDCADPEQLDFDGTAYDATEVRYVSVSNVGTGNAPLTITDVYVTNSTGNAGLFTLEYFVYVPDPNSPGDYLEEPVTDFPAQPRHLNAGDGLDPTEAFMVKVSFWGHIEGYVPPENVMVETNDATDPHHAIPIVGVVLCPPGKVDANNDPSDGCECTPDNPPDEVCDGRDNDCNGQIDDGVSPGLCLMCDANGFTVPADDDAACGSIACSGWYVVVGDQGPTGTASCFGHEPITDHRCEGGGDCKDPNSVDCSGQPVLSNPQITCAVCKYVGGCTGATAGNCANFTAGTVTSLCHDCDGAGNERVAADDQACGTIDCSNWYAKTGTQGVMNTEQCFPHQDMQSFRCKNPGICKSPNTADCNGEPLEAVAQITCGVCRYMTTGTCTGNTAGACTNYGNGTLTSGTCGLGTCQDNYHCENGVEVCNQGTPAPDDQPDDSFVDNNCDGIDGNESQAVFVDTVTGNDGWLGTKTNPKRTIQSGITRAFNAGRPDVYVSAGTYNEAVVLLSGVSVYGGYSRANNWARSNSYQVVIQAPASTAVLGNSVSNVTLDHLEIRSANATTNGGSSYAIRLNGCSNITVRQSDIIGDDGAPGSNGSNGSTGSSGNSGGDGVTGCEDSTWPCSSCSRPAAGTSGAGCTFSYRGGTGGRPGHENSWGDDGTAGQGGSGGSGGWGGWVDRDSCGSCGSGDWNGRPGGTGGAGSAGANGSGGSNFNTGSTTDYVSSDGGNGGWGSHGSGGGGGGGGRGGDVFCNSYGSSGGGGGGGGCRGTMAWGGTGAGGSFAVWAYNSSSININNCSVTTGSGGAGGTGGTGGSGGSGGSGGARGGYNGCGSMDDAGCGGVGGNGGAGGRGGHGGGGGGGPSIGIAWRSCSSCSQSSNSFSLGSAGSGGWSPGPDGATGLRQNTYSF